jgi:hypothetical protein
MPNETLISQLDSLRETYVQREKTAAGLQAAFKLTTNAHGKTQKALGDYGAQDATVDVRAAQAAFAALRLKEDAIDPLLPDLRREIKALAGVTSALKEATAALRSIPVDVVRLDKAATHLQSFKEQPVVDLLPALQQELDLAQRALGDEFGQKLRGALAELGVAIGGRAPKFVLGRFELDANFAKRAAVLRYGKDIVVPHVPITVDATLKAYQGATKLISGRTQDGAAWMAQFAEAYQVARRKRERAADEKRVNIVDVYLELVLSRQGRAFASEPSKRTFTDYTRAQFIFDFYEFTNRRRVAHNGQVVKTHGATKSQTDNPAKSMWIVEGDGPYDGRYVADVEFDKE